MLKIFVIAGACVMLSPLLFADMFSSGGMSGMSGSGMGQGTGGSSFHSGSGKQGKGSEQEKRQDTAIRVSTNSIEDILSFKDQIGLTGQQVISIQMVDADAQEEAAEKSKTVEGCLKEYTKSLKQSKPDFAYSRSMLNKLTVAQASAQAVPLDAYEKAYALLTDEQKTHLELLRAMRQQEIEKAEAALQESRQAPPPGPSTNKR